MTFGQIIDRVFNEREFSRRMEMWKNPSWWNLLVILPWTIGAIFLIQTWRVDSDIATREQTAQGIITTHDPANHNRYGYTFSVNGKTFNGWQSPGNNEYEIGKQVLVFYDPRDPNKNSLTEFGDLGTEILSPVPVLLLGIGGVAWFIIIKRRQKRNRSDQMATPSASA